MDAPSSLIRGGPWKYFALIALVASVALANPASADPTKNFKLTGSGTLKPDQRTQQSGALTLKAYLTPKDAALAASPPVQEGNGFVLMARLASSPAVCYNDTIFRDDFDGDGG